MNPLFKMHNDVINRITDEDRDITKQLTKEEKIQLMNARYNFSHGKGKRKKHKSKKRKR